MARAWVAHGAGSNLKPSGAGGPRPTGNIEVPGPGREDQQAGPSVWWTTGVKGQAQQMCVPSYGWGGLDVQKYCKTFGFLAVWETRMSESI